MLSKIPKFFKFAVTGLVGFSVDSGLLYLLLNIGFGAYSARAISIPVAMLATWIINRNWSFTKSDKSWSIELIQYAGVAGFAALINYGVYALALQFIAGMTPFWALVLASAIAMFVSYFGYGRVVFGKS
jgi:putative flippase GtrA